MRFVHSLLLLGLICTPAFSKDKNKKAGFDQEELDRSTARGRQLYEYDQAAWHATDALLAQKPDTSRVEFYVARKTEEGWLVSWGKFNDANDAFLVSYQVLLKEGSPDRAEIRTLATAIENRDLEFFEARARKDAAARFGEHGRPYNIAIIPAEAGLYVYLIPAQTDDKVFPLGGDVRYLYSADGTKLLETRQMHKSVLEFQMQSNTVATFHTHVLSDSMEDSDFYYALAMNRSLTIATNKGLLKVDPNERVAGAKR
jgi:hypothetical protein